MLPKLPFSPYIPSENNHLAWNPFLGENGEKHQWGYVDAEGRTVIPPRFDDAYHFSANALALVLVDGKWGYINPQGEIAIPARFDNADHFSGNERARVLVDGKWGYINSQGEMTIPANFEEAYSFQNESLAKVKVNGKYGFINAKGEMVVSPHFDRTYTDYAEVDGFIEVEFNSKRGFLNSKGKIVVPAVLESDYYKFSENGLRRVRVGGKFGYINTHGQLITPICFDHAGYFVCGLAIFKMNNKYGYVNERGEIAIPASFDDAHDFESNGLAQVKLNGKYGFINILGKIVIPFSFDFVKYSGCGDECKSFSENGLAAVRVNGKYGYINAKGEMVIPPKFDNASSFGRSNVAEIEINGRGKGYVDSRGNVVIPPADEFMGSFNEAASMSCALFNSGLKAVRIDEKWGYVNSRKEMIIPPVFDDVREFSNNGFSSVSMNKRYFYINTKCEKIRAEEKRSKTEVVRLRDEDVLKNWAAICAVQTEQEPVLGEFIYQNSMKFIGRLDWIQALLEAVWKHKVLHAYLAQHAEALLSLLVNLSVGGNPLWLPLVMSRLEALLQAYAGGNAGEYLETLTQQPEDELHDLFFGEDAPEEVQIQCAQAMCDNEGGTYSMYDVLLERFGHSRIPEIQILCARMVMDLYEEKKHDDCDTDKELAQLLEIGAQSNLQEVHDMCVEVVDNEDHDWAVKIYDEFWVRHVDTSILKVQKLCALVLLNKGVILCDHNQNGALTSYEQLWTHYENSPVTEVQQLAVLARAYSVEPLLILGQKEAAIARIHEVQSKIQADDWINAAMNFMLWVAGSDISLHTVMTTIRTLIRDRYWNFARNDLLVQNLSEPQKSQAKCIMHYFSWRPNLLELEQCLEQCLVSQQKMPYARSGGLLSDELPQESLRQSEDTTYTLSTILKIAYYNFGVFVMPFLVLMKTWQCNWLSTVLLLIAVYTWFRSARETQVMTLKQRVFTLITVVLVICAVLYSNNEISVPPQEENSVQQKLETTEIPRRYTVEIVWIYSNMEKHLADVLHESAGFSEEQAKIFAANVAKRHARKKPDSPPQRFMVDLTRSGAWRLKEGLAMISAKFTITPENLSQSSEETHVEN
jgi:hypothetical protein